MKVIDQKVSILEQVSSGCNIDKNSTAEDISNVQNILFQNILNHIEACNSICNDIDVKEIIKDGKNLDILEHGTVYLTIPIGKPDPGKTQDYMRRMQIVNFYQNDPNSVVKGFKSDEENILYVYFITTNYRVIIENNRHSDLVFLFNCSPYHDIRQTYSIVTNKSIMDVLTKHKNISISSSKLLPTSKELVLVGNVFKNNPELSNSWINICKDSYDLYNKLIDRGFDECQASQVLPNSCQINIVLTGFKDDLEDLFKEITEESTDYNDLLHMIRYDSDNSEINNTIADEVVEENSEELSTEGIVEKLEGNVDVPE